LNTALAARKLDVPTTLVSKIGCDLFGDLILKTLEENGLETRHIVRSKEFPTGITFIAVINSERTFFSFRKNAADIHIFPYDLKGINLDYKNVFLAGTVVFEGVESFETVIELVQKLRKKNSRVYFDPNMRVEPSRFQSRIERALRITDVLLPSQTEIQKIISGKSPEERFDKIFDYGISEIWLKKGEKGSELITRTEHLSFPPARVHSLDSTGAGDAYDGCILWGSLRGFSRPKIGRYANAYAGLSTEKIGAGEVYPSLDQFLNSSQYLEIEEGGSYA
jgi:sugar/nucleoside kinase (ribokinase family)